MLFVHGKGRSVPGFYLHLEPGTCVGGGGIYHPDAAVLGHIRDRMLAKPREWEGILRKGIPIEGDALKRAPAGYDSDHRFVQDLKRKWSASDPTSTRKRSLSRMCGR